MVPCQAVETCKIGKKLPALECYDPRSQRMLFASQPGLVEVRVEDDEKKAKSLEDGPDLFEKTKIKIDRPLGDPAAIAGMTLQTVGTANLALLTESGQKVARTASGEYVLELGKRGPATVPAKPQEIAEALKESAACPVADGRIRELARQAVGDATSSKTKVERLVHFVAHYLTYDIAANPLTIGEIISTRKGKCVDYAELFAVLARAEGIPARTVSGFYYLGDREQAFGGHAWDDVVLDGRWVGVDPTLDEVELDGAHIHLEESPFAAASHGIAALQLIAVDYARQEYENPKGLFSLQLPGGSWHRMAKSPNPAAEVAFMHKSGEAFGMVIAEEHYIPILHIPQTMKLSDLKKAVLANLRVVDPRARVVRERAKKVQGHEAVVVTLEAEMGGEKLSYDVLLHSAGATTVQVFVWSPRSRFADLQADLDAFLDGFAIPEKK
jgi:hypothetical protein